MGKKSAASLRVEPTLDRSTGSIAMKGHATRMPGQRAGLGDGNDERQRFNSKE